MDERESVVSQPPQTVLRAGDLRVLLERLVDAFDAHRDEIDALNVFPVPDGDTGTNLLHTARTALDEIRLRRPADEMLPATLVRGALLGARGNSGVILSQVLRGFADTV
ncbi:MAG TPA: DAK2 domain-containing protein, partial [Nitriliruptorales bacterium]|nr:DAK2 domain-containing protein [Nitriliruptorales bacterium]